MQISSTQAGDDASSPKFFGGKIGNSVRCARTKYSAIPASTRESIDQTLKVIAVCLVLGALRSTAEAAQAQGTNNVTDAFSKTVLNLAAQALNYGMEIGVGQATIRWMSRIPDWIADFVGAALKGRQKGAISMVGIGELIQKMGEKDVLTAVGFAFTFLYIAGNGVIPYSNSDSKITIVGALVVAGASIAKNIYQKFKA